MKVKILLCIALVVITLISLTSLAGAAVPWITQSYEAFAMAGEDLRDPACPDEICVVDQSLGPPLPISASVYYGFPGFEVTVDSEITSSSIILAFDRSGYDYRYLRALAYANFHGNYIADNNYFVFSSDNSIPITVNDVTTSTTLLSANTAGIYYVPTPLGDEIEVTFGTTTGEVAGTGRQTGLYSLTYGMNTAVVPEPISSILFITGGTLLAGRRYLRRKK